MAISASKLVRTSEGTIRKLANGKYRLTKNAPILEFLYLTKENTFMFFVDEGFLIKSFYFKEKKGKKIRRVEVKEVKMPSGLIELLDMEMIQNFSGKGSTYSLVIDMEKYIPKVSEIQNLEINQKHN
tara:strand:- start:200 stop:580 length:381 start_codon:yes stop_codon:yes gene_type:complete